jgi:arginase
LPGTLLGVIEIHGAPYDLGGARQGSRLGPAALRLAGLTKSLREVLGDSSINERHNIVSVKPNELVNDLGDLVANLQQEPGDGLPYADALQKIVLELKERAAKTLQHDRLPLMLGGEHSLSMGPVQACVDKYGDELAVLWIDAHADINTPSTSSTLNVHGMPLALLSGYGSGVGGKTDEHWKTLKKELGEKSLKVENICWFGLRDVDSGEKPRAKQGFPISMHDIDRDGVQECWEKTCQRIEDRGCKYVYISFDVDALDPVLAPGTGTAVRGGLTYREAHLLAELIHKSLTTTPKFKLVGLDIVEVSPVHDHNNQTATVAVEWVASLFGKSIL